MPRRATQSSVGFITNGADDTDLSQVVSYTFSSKLITLDGGQFTVAGALIGATTPTLKWVSDGTTVVLTGAWAGLGTASATATIDVGDGNYKASGQFYVKFDSTLPTAQGIKEVPTSIHKATFNGTDMYVGTTTASLNLTNLPNTGDMGISFEYRTRAVTEIAKRENIVANGNGIAKSTGYILATSAGTISGGIVTGLSAAQSINVVYAMTPGTSDKIWIYYSFVPPQSPTLPSTLSVKMLHVEDRMLSSNLGTGGGNDGQPFFNPLLHIPENSASQKTLT